MPFADPIRRREYQRTYQKTWRLKNPQKVKAFQKAYSILETSRKAHREREKERRRKNPEAYRAYRRNYLKTYRCKTPRDAERARNTRYKKSFGITVQQYESMLSLQRGCCAICLGIGTQQRRLHVDHDHKSGKVRGLLCTRCNNTLERVESIPDWGTKAKSYLENTP